MHESAFTPQRHIICNMCKILFLLVPNFESFLISEVLLVKTYWIPDEGLPGILGCFVGKLLCFSYIKNNICSLVE